MYRSWHICTHTHTHTDQQANRLSAQPSTASEPSTIPQPTADDGHLDLLCSEDDEELLALSTSPRPFVIPSSAGDKLDGRLAMLRSSLLSEISEREKRESLSEPTEEGDVSPERLVSTCQQTYM